MGLGQRLNHLRITNSLSLQNVADAIGISKAHIWNLEHGQSENPTLEVLIKLAGLYRVSVSMLVGESPDPQDQPGELIAMFRDIKSLDARDRETVRVLLEHLCRGKRD